MNEVETAPVASERRIVSRMEEFRRAILVAPVLSIGGVGLCGFLHYICRFDSDGVSVFLWFLLSASEAWFQFQGVLRRAIWIMAGLVTGGVIVYATSGEVYGPTGIAYFAIPAAIETMCAWGCRRHAWVWLIATPLIYGSMDSWGRWLFRLVGEVMPIVRKTFRFPTAVSDEFAVFASFIGLIFITRAIVRSFIARRKDPEVG